MKVEDIDFLRRTLTVSRQVQRAGKNQIEIRPPKYGSERVVFLPPALLNMLAAHVERGVRSEGWLFVGAGDNPPHQNMVGYWWRMALRDAGLKDTMLHGLRHFYASGLIAQGCDVVTVQRALGHAKASTTLDTFSHLWPTAAERITKASEAIMTSAVGNLADSVWTDRH